MRREYVLDLWHVKISFRIVKFYLKIVVAVFSYGVFNLM